MVNVTLRTCTYVVLVPTYLLYTLGHVTVGRMCDLLLEMMQTTDQIIREKLNGFHFGRVFHAQSDCCRSLHEKLDVLKDSKERIVQVRNHCTLNILTTVCYSHVGQYFPILIGCY